MKNTTPLNSPTRWSWQPHRLPSETIALPGVDTFSFTSSRTIPFFFKLCEASCNTGSGNDKDGNPDSLDVTIANFSVLDADGNVMMTTNGNNPTKNYGEVCVEGGVITYIAVRADNTMSSDQEYRLSAFETL